MSLADDLILTAYALGELDPEARAAVEARLASDPAARAAVEETRATAATLSRGLATEPVPALPVESRCAVLTAARGAGGGVVIKRGWVWAVPRIGIAAVLVLGVTVLALGRGGAGASRHEMKTVAATPPTGAAPRRFRGTEIYLGPRNYAPQEAPDLPEAEALDGPAAGPVAGRRVSIPYDDILEGTPASPQGVPFGIKPVPPSTGTGGDSGVFYSRPGSGGAGIPLPGGMPVGVPGPAVGAEAGMAAPEAESIPSESPGSEAYARLIHLAYASPRRQPLSTFAVDVDTASYSNVRRFLEQGALPPPEAVRVEEMVNYFRYADPAPDGDKPIAVRVEAAACPWALDHRLVRIALKAREVERKARPSMNLVFLIDVSGSMDSPEKLPLVKASMRMLLDELNERDSVAIVTYAGESGLRLAPTSCEKKREIMDAVDGLQAGGSTNGASGIALAYDAAARGYKAGGVNRVILCTDGDFNVGATSHQELLALITEKAKTSHTFLTVLGYGMGNLKDDTLELLADHGNGAYGYVDSTKEAHRILVEQAGGTLVTVAKDVKIQVDFNPAVVAAYRLVGYENRLLAARDFKDDTKDGGEMGAGHAVTALYEIVPVGKEVPGQPPAPDVEPSKYGREARPSEPAPAPAPAAGEPGASRETLTVRVRWKQPDADVSVPMEVPLTDGGLSYDKASADFKFAAAVASFAQILRGSPHRGVASLDGVLELAGEGLAFDPDGRRHEFVDLVAKAKALSGARR